MARVAKELHFKFYIILIYLNANNHIELITAILDSTGL